MRFGVPLVARWLKYVISPEKMTISHIGMMNLCAQYALISMDIRFLTF